MKLNSFKDRIVDCYCEIEDILEESEELKK